MNPKKVICPCYQITKGDIIAAVEGGAKTYKEVKKLNKAGSNCKSCKKRIKKFMKKLTETK